MKDYFSVVSAQPLPDCRVRVTFENGAQGVFDCTPYTADKYWSRLADPAFFRLVRVEFGTLVWPGDIDIDPEEVWEDSTKDVPVSSARYPEIEVPPLFVAEEGATYDKPKESAPPPSP